MPSNTNHNSEKRAAAWETTMYAQLGAYKAWNWDAVTRTSGRINRRIKSIAVDKRGSRPILPAAAKLIASGLKARDI